MIQHLSSIVVAKRNRPISSASSPSSSYSSTHRPPPCRSSGHPRKTRFASSSVGGCPFPCLIQTSWNLCSLGHHFPPAFLSAAQNASSDAPSLCRDVGGDS